MEDLNKTQMALLTVLISFVVSIGTGIMTFTLINEAPPVVSQTINRIVERTIEQVVPGEQVATVKYVTETVVISEDSKIADVVEKNKDSIVRVFMGSTLNDRPHVFVALGLIISEKGDIISSVKNINDHNEFSVELADGRRLNIGYEKSDDSYPHHFKIKKEGFIKLEKFNAVKFSTIDSLQLGQSIITISGIERNTLANGIITGLQLEADGQTPVSYFIPLVETSITTHQLAGSAIYNIDGEVIGMKTGLGVEGKGEYTFFDGSVAQLTEEE